MINKTSQVSLLRRGHYNGGQIHKVTSNCGRFYKGNKQRPLTERKGEGSALERAARERANRGGDRSRDEQCQTCPDVIFCFLKKKISIANDIRLPFVCFGGKYIGIYYLLHLSVLRMFSA